MRVPCIHILHSIINDLAKNTIILLKNNWNLPIYMILYTKSEMKRRYAYDDVENDEELKHFSIERDLPRANIRSSTAMKKSARRR